MVADLVSPEAICGYRFVTAEASNLLDPVGLLAAAARHVDHAMRKCVGCNPKELQRLWQFVSSRHE